MSNGKDRHADGQKDYAEGNGYNAPHGFFDEMTTWSEKGSREIVEDNKEYRAGWNNAKSQDKG